MDYINKKVIQSRGEIEKIISQSGTILCEYFKKGVRREYKGPIDYITEADTASEKFISNELKKKFPDDSFLCEEGSYKTGNSEFTWCVDPLDGTTNFSHQLPFYSVSIGLCLQTANLLVPVYGFIYLPHWNTLYQGGPTVPSLKNKASIRISDAEKLEEALITTGFPYNRREIISSLQNNLYKILQSTQGIRRTGSACMDLCYTAEGRFDGYYETGLHSWDLAAGVAIVEGAGGSVKNYRGEKVNIEKGEIIAGSKKIVDELVKLNLE
jgi:myo-inositol-1(or 4)-monophosphatase